MLSTLAVGVLEASLAVAILSRGSAVRTALYVGGAFSVLGAVTGSPAETIGYGLLAALHFWLASQHDKSGTPGLDKAIPPTE